MIAGYSTGQKMLNEWSTINNEFLEDDLDEEEHFDNSALNEGLEEYVQKYLTRDLQGQKRMVRMGNLYLPNDLPEGDCRELTEEELKLLQQL